jgi:hypothetical protein
MRLAEHALGWSSAGIASGRAHAARSCAVPRSIASRLAQKAAQRASSTRPELAALLGEAQVGVVLAQAQAVLGARGEHAVGLGHAAGDQVVHQHAEVGLVAARAPGLAALHLQRGVGAGEQALRGGFLVAGGAVDLAGEEQPADRLGLQAGLEVARVEVVVLDGVAGAQDVAFSRPRMLRTICSCTSKGSEVEMPFG